METPDSTYREPRRRPGRRSLERLLAAAEAQLREAELDAFTVQNVLARTGLSVGAFYARFPDKTALLHAAQERFHDRLEPLILSRLAALTEAGTETLEEAVDRGFGTLAEHVLAERELTRAFIMLSVFDPVMRRKGEQVNHDRRHAIETMLAPHREEIEHPDFEAAVTMAYAMYTTFVRGRLVFYPSANEMQLGVTDDSVFAQLRLSLASFLRGDFPGDRTDAG